MKTSFLFSCTDCGNCCCGQGMVFVSQQEATAILEYLNLDAASNIFSQSEKRVVLPVASYGCLFWIDKQCSIYPVRPIQCRTFPFWKKNLASLEAWEACAKICEGIGRGRQYSNKEIAALQNGESSTGNALQLVNIPKSTRIAETNDLAFEAFGMPWKE